MNLLRLINPSLEVGYCSTILSNHGPIRIKRFVSQFSPEDCGMGFVSYSHLILLLISGQTLSVTVAPKKFCKLNGLKDSATNGILKCKKLFVWDLYLVVKRKQQLFHGEQKHRRVEQISFSWRKSWGRSTTSSLATTHLCSCAARLLVERMEHATQKFHGRAS